jgi:hypothetical protein
MLLELMMLMQQQQRVDHSGGEFVWVSDDMWTPRISSGDSGGLGAVEEEDIHHHHHHHHLDGYIQQQLESPGVQIGCKEEVN